MTRDEVIALAREAGASDITSHRWTSWVGTQSTDFLERFAALVAAHEREVCAGIAERRFLPEGNDDQRIGHYQACKNIAAAIRSRT